MSWDEDVEKCPDEGKWCDACHDLCEGEESDCNAMEIRRMQEAIDKVKEIADSMRFGPIPKHRHDDELLRHFADQINEAIKDFAKGKTR